MDGVDDAFVEGLVAEGAVDGFGVVVAGCEFVLGVWDNGGVLLPGDCAKAPVVIAAITAALIR